MTLGVRVRRAISLSLGAFLSLLAVSAALSAGTGAVPTQTQCQYGVCTSSGPPSLWALALLVPILVGLLLLALILLSRRRAARSFPESGGPTPWVGPAPDEGVEATVIPAGATAPASGSLAAAYLETPEDVGSPPPPIPTPEARPPSEEVSEDAAPPGPPASIDSLMDELDKISGEMMRPRPEAKKPSPPPDEELPSSESS